MDQKTLRAWEALCDRATHGDTPLSREERTWVNVRGLIDSVEGGGLISYFYNSGADSWTECRGDLGTLGATQVLAEVERVADLFPPDVPADLSARNEIIESWPEGLHDRVLEEANRVLMPLMPDLEARLAAFVRANGLA